MRRADEMSIVELPVPGPMSRTRNSSSVEWATRSSSGPCRSCWDGESGLVRVGVEEQGQVEAGDLLKVETGVVLVEDLTQR